jgi:hypothetical protein
VPFHVDLRTWDGDFVARCDVNGATYLLSPLAGEALKALQAGAVFPEEIVGRLLDNDATPATRTTAALVSMFAGRDADIVRVLEVLTELEALGIAEARFA